VVLAREGCAVKLRWQCPLCAQRYWWRTKSCKPCAMRIMGGAFERAMNEVIASIGAVTLPEQLREALERDERRGLN